MLTVMGLCYSLSIVNHAAQRHMQIHHRYHLIMGKKKKKITRQYHNMYQMGLNAICIAYKRTATYTSINYYALKVCIYSCINDVSSVLSHISIQSVFCLDANCEKGCELNVNER